MDPFDKSSTESESSDWNLDEYTPLYESALKDSASSSSNSRFLTAYGSSSLSSNTCSSGSPKMSLPFKGEPALNKFFRNSNWYTVRHDVSSNHGSQSDKKDIKRKLPSYIQQSYSSSSRPTLQRHENDGQFSHYRPEVVQETVDDERLIYQVALRDLSQPVIEATLPHGLLSVPLFRHQKIALAWMLEKENSVLCSGGILADDQGLGKTISIIALIQMQKSLSKPKSVNPRVSNAEALYLDDDNGKCIVDSSRAELEFHNRKPQGGSLVVCPASVLRQWARELDEKVADESKLEVLIYHGGNRTDDPDELAKYDVVLTTYSIVAKEVPTKTYGDDDSHQFHVGKKRKKGGKGRNSSVIDHNGTLAKVNWFRVILDEAQTIKNFSTQVSNSCCGLRAKKRWCLSGTPLQNSIDELFSYFRFLKCEPYANYKSFCNQIKIPIFRNHNHGYMKLQAVLKAIMLRRTKDTLIGGNPIINLPPKTIKLTAIDFSKEERAFYLKLQAESRSRYKEYEAAGTVRQNYGNILSMLLRLRQACDHPLLVKAFDSESISQASTKMANNLPKDMQANLLKVLETLNICLLCSGPPEDAVVTICGHVFCYQCVSEYLTGDDNMCPSSNCKNRIGSDVVFTKATLTSCISNDDDDDDDDHHHHHQNSSRSDERSSVFQSDYTSAKIKATLEIIQSYCKSNNSQSEAPLKAIIFSQWTRMLDLVEASLNQNCIEYRRLDGSMSLVSRDRAVKEFNTDPQVIVMLMSLKAGNVGLNMVAASHVILLDLWWNPATEDQAIDRAHRIGQTRNVTVSRLTIKNTIEDRILALQEAKRKLHASVFDEDESGKRSFRLTAEDLRYLFIGAD